MSSNTMASKPTGGVGGAAPKVSLTVEEKQQLIAKAEQEPTWSQSALAKWATATFGLYTPLNRTTVSKILLRAEEIKSVDEFFLKRYNVTRPQFPELEEELVQWIVMVRKQGAGVTGAMIQAEAANIAARRDIPKDKFKCSNGWLERFQHRYRDSIESTLREYAEATGAPITSFGAAPAPRKSSAGKRGSGISGVLAGNKKSALAGGKRTSKKVPMPSRSMLVSLGGAGEHMDVTSEHLGAAVEHMGEHMSEHFGAHMSDHMAAHLSDHMEQKIPGGEHLSAEHMHAVNAHLSANGMTADGVTTVHAPPLELVAPAESLDVAHNVHQYRVDEAVAAVAAAVAAADEHNHLAAHVGLAAAAAVELHPSVEAPAPVVAETPSAPAMTTEDTPSASATETPADAPAPSTESATGDESSASHDAIASGASDDSAAMIVST